MTTTGKLVFPFDFVRIVVDTLSEHGLNNGDIVFVTGSKALPVSQEDPYTQRIKLFVQPMEGDNIINDKGIFMIDPKSVERIDDDENKRLYEVATHRLSAQVDEQYELLIGDNFDTTTD